MRASWLSVGSLATVPMGVTAGSSQFGRLQRISFLYHPGQKPPGAFVPAAESRFQNRDK